MWGVAGVPRIGRRIADLRFSNKRLPSFGERFRVRRFHCLAKRSWPLADRCVRPAARELRRHGNRHGDTGAGATVRGRPRPRATAGRRARAARRGRDGVLVPARRPGHGADDLLAALAGARPTAARPRRRLRDRLPRAVRDRRRLHGADRAGPGADALPPADPGRAAGRQPQLGARPAARLRLRPDQRRPRLPRLRRLLARGRPGPGADRRRRPGLLLGRLADLRARAASPSSPSTSPRPRFAPA